MKDWKDLLLEIKPSLPEGTLPGDLECSFCLGKGKVRISCCTEEPVHDSKFCPKCNNELDLNTCPECSGTGYEPQ